MVKIGNVQLTQEEAEKIYTSNRKYLVTYNKIYAIHHSTNAGYYGSVVYQLTKKGEHFTKRGRFFAYPASEVNHLLGFNLLQEG